MSTKQWYYLQFVNYESRMPNELTVACAGVSALDSITKQEFGSFVKFGLRIYRLQFETIAAIV